jgi:hypothetical protein
VPTEVRLTPTFEKNPKAENAQVIFFETFTWRRTGEGRSSLGMETVTPAVEPSTPPEPLLTRGAGFSRMQPFVGTTVFLWFTPSTGNLRGPWPPINSRRSWTGTADFWAGQLKQMMMANIDAIYVHCVDQYIEQRVEFFKAYAELRRNGWDVPKLAPFLDPYNLWENAPIDVSTPKGKDAFVEPLIRFFAQYFEANDDHEADSYLLRIDGRVVLTTWWVAHILRNVEALSRLDVEARLVAALGSTARVFRNGVHAITTALIDPDLVFSDERMVVFSGYAYAIHSVHNGIDTWHVQPGYWDQNIRKPGYLLPRDGGKNYRRAWEIAVANAPQRVYVESWNEYDEGSGIYAANPGALFRDLEMHDSTDVFSDRNDPFEYIRTTAAGAARINGRPAYDAHVIYCAAPDHVSVGTPFDVTVIARNDGNTPWRQRDDISLVCTDAGRLVATVRLNDAHDECALYDGIFRGRPKTFSLRIDAGAAPRELVLSLSMKKGGTPFGHPHVVRVQVG